MAKFENVAFVPDFGEFAVLKSLLESEGIAVLDIARGGHATIAGVEHGYYARVPSLQAVCARRLLKCRSFESFVVSVGFDA